MIFTFWISYKASCTKTQNGLSNQFLTPFIYVWPNICHHHTPVLRVVPCLRTYVWICQIVALFSYQSKIDLPTLIRHFLALFSCFFQHKIEHLRLFTAFVKEMFTGSLHLFKNKFPEKKLFLKLHQYWWVRKTSFFLKSTTNSICSSATQFYEFFSPSGHFSSSLLFCHQGIWVLTT